MGLGLGCGHEMKPMKRLLTLFATLLAVVAGAAEATNAPPAKAQGGRAAPSLQVQTPAPVPLVLPTLQEPKPNEVFAGKVTYSGIAVQAVKAKNPLRLLNPAARPQYGSGLDNLVRYRASGTGPLLKIFSLDF